MGRRALIVYNPMSGSRSAQSDLADVRAYLTERGWSIDLAATRAPGDAGRLAREAAHADQDVVLIAGGDGTLNEAVNALTRTRTALGVLPCGTANVWARQLGMRVHRGLIDAARLMADAVVRAIDVGCITINLGTEREAMRYFLLWSGLGLDAYAIRSIEPRLASFKRWGALGYSLAVWRAMLRYRGVEVDIELDDRCEHAQVMLIIVSNAELYAGYFHLSPQARLDDGWLDVSVVRGSSLLQMVSHFGRVALRRSPATRRAKRVRVTARGQCDVHVDAEPIDVTPVAYTVVSKALRVLVPPTAPRTLFVSDPGAH